MSEEAISLYFGLEQGSGPDMDIIGRCFIQLSSAIKECSYFLDPALEIRIEIVRERDGSVIIDFIVKSIRKVIGDKPTLSDLAIVILCLLGTDLRQYVDNKFLDKIFAPASPAKDNETGQQTVDKDRLDKILDRVEKGDVGGTYIRNFYGQLYQDRSITGVGAARGHDRSPSIIVKRDDFQRRSHVKSAEQVERVRVRLEEHNATLVAPVLVAGAQKWRFRDGKLKFSAPILDRNFREKLLAGRTNIQLQAGIQMDIVVSVLENKVNGVWVPASREVVEVKSIKAAPHQPPLDFDPK